MDRDDPATGCALPTLPHTGQTFHAVHGPQMLHHRSQDIPLNQPGIFSPVLNGPL